MTAAPIGRPLLFPDVDTLSQTIDAYFTQCDTDKRPYTMAGLARALGCSRQTLINYEGREGYLDTIKNARLRVEQWVEESLWSKCHPAGPIFSLKNNFGWRDEQQVEHTHTLVAVGAVPAPRLSPVVNVPIALSPAPNIAVSEDVIEAKATPIDGVSPVSVA